MMNPKGQAKGRTGRGRAKAEVDFRAVADSLPVLVLVFDAVGACVFANAHLRQVTGLEAEAWLGAGWLQAVHPEDRDGAAAAWSDALAASEPYEIEVRLRAAGGDHAWHLLRATPDREDGRVLRWVGHATDIDDQKRLGAARAATLAAAADRSEAARRAAQELAQRLAEATADCVKTLSLDGRLLSMNDAGLRAMEVDCLDGLLGARWVEWWRPTGYHLAAQKAVDEALAGRTGRFTAFCRTPRGTPKWWDVIVTPVRDAKGEVERLLSVSRDVTQAREASDRFRLIAETVREVFYQVDLQTRRVIYVSPAAAAVFGRSPAEIMAEPLAFADTIHPEDRPRVLAAVERQRRGEATRLEYRLLHPNGAVRHVRDLAHPIFDAEGRPVQIVGSVEDLSAVGAAAPAGASGTADADLARRADELEALYASLPMGVALVDRDLRYRRINARMAEIDGRSAGDYLGRTIREAVPEVADVVEPIVRDVLETGRPVRDLEVSGETAARPGTIRHWLASYDPVQGADGQVLGVHATVVEISDRKRTEDALRASEERFRLALEAVDGIVYDYDLATGRVERGGRTLEITGFRPEEIPPAAEWWRERIHPDDLGRLAERERLAVLSRQGRTESEYRVRHRDGRWVEVLDRNVVIHGAEGPLRIVGSTIDVTAYNAAEAELRQSESRFRAVFENAGVGVARASLVDGRCLEVNDRVCAILGYTREELLALPWPDITHPDDLEPDLRQFRRLAAGEIDGYTIEKRYLRKNGEIVWARLTLSLVRDAEGRPSFEVAIVEDISERKAAEAALRDSEELNRRILSASPDCIKLLSLDARLEFFSEGGLCAMEIDDFDRQLRGADWVTFWQPEDQPRVREAIGAARAGRTGRFQAFCRTAKGTPKWWDVSVTAILGADGRPERLLSVSRDITETKRAEDRLALLTDAAGRLLVAREPSTMIREVYDLIAGPLRLDACFNYRLTEAGGLALAAQAGLSDGAAAAGAWLEMGQAVCGRVARDRVPVHVQRVQASEDPEHAFIKAQGLTAYACTPLLVGDRLLGTLGFGRRSGERFDDDELSFLRTICHYVAMALERMRSEEELRGSEDRVRRLLDQLYVFVGVTALDGTMIEVNRAPLAAAGIEARDVLGRRFWDTHWIAHSPALQEKVRDAFARAAAGEVVRFDLPSRTVGEACVTVDFQVGPVRDGQGRITHLVPSGVVVEDRVRAETELKRLNAELEARVAERTASLEGTAQALQAEMTQREAAQAQLLQAQKMEALGQLVGGVAHDFNNILAAIQGAFSVLDRRVEEPKLRFVIEQGQKAGERASTLIRQMLAFARRETIEPKVVDLAQVFDDVESMASYTVGTKVECRFEAEPGTWPVLVDPHQLEVALLNLSANARDAMPDGGSLIVSARNLGPGEGRPATLGPGEHVVIQVTDTGWGMDAATAARVFEPFFTTKKAGQGTGLGLAQVHGFATGAGGAVAVESAPGRGTTVAIYLPRSAIRPAEAGAPAIVSADLHGRATVLLVDDDDQVRPVTAAYLRELGYAVVEAGSAGVAMAMAQLHRVDLLVADVVMPGTDGPALARSLRAERPGLPVLFITGFAAEHVPAGETVVAKPFTGSELALHVLEGLGRLPEGTARRLNAAPRPPERLLARLTTPALRAAYDRWAASLEGRRLPDLAAFDLDGLATEAMVVLRPEGAGDSLTFRVQSLGEALARRLDRPLVGEAITPEHEEVLGVMDMAYRRCLSTLGPTYDWARARLGGTTVRFERLVLPFSADGAHITHLLSFVLLAETGQGPEPSHQMQN